MRRQASLQGSEEANRLRNRVRIVASVLVVIGFTGFMVDLLGGLPFARESRSQVAWLLGIVGLGALWVTGEAVAAWIADPDQVSDPIWKRALRLSLLLALVVVVFAAATWLFAAIR
jgi:hypothetical protein